jgi:hypothetical protein
VQDDECDDQEHVQVGIVTMYTKHQCTRVNDLIPQMDVRYTGHAAWCLNALESLALARDSTQFAPLPPVTHKDTTAMNGDLRVRRLAQYSLGNCTLAHCCAYSVPCAHHT